MKGTPEMLVGFEVETRGIPRTGYLIFDKNQQRHRSGYLREHSPLRLITESVWAMSNPLHCPAW